MKSWKNLFKHYQDLHEETNRGYLSSTEYEEFGVAHHGCTDSDKCTGCSWWCKQRGQGMKFVPIHQNWIKGYAFDITKTKPLKPKVDGPSEGFIRCWVNLSNEQINEEGGRYPCFTMQFRKQGHAYKSEKWAREMAVQDSPYDENNDEMWALHQRDNWMECGGDLAPDCCENPDPEPCSSADKVGFSVCTNCGVETPNIDYYDVGVKKGIGDYVPAVDGGQEATKEAFKDVLFTQNQEVWLSSQEIMLLMNGVFDINRDALKELCEQIGMRLPRPTGGEERLARQDDAWAPWVVKRGQTIHGYPHLALAALMWLSQIEGKLDNNLLLSIHKKLLHKNVPGLDESWRERDVLFIVEILRLLCFEKGHHFKWTPVPV